LTAETEPARWNGLIVSLHWIGAAIILALLVIGWAMLYGDLDAATTFDLYQWHKSLGFVALALTVARLVARFAGSSPPPPTSPAWERLLAALAQVSLYLLTICAIVSGWLVVSASPLPIPTRFFNLFVIPNIAPADPSLFAAAALAHKVAAWAIAFLVALHVAGALKHHFANRDDVLTRMSPKRPKLGGSPR
jgi:cytochrome b561